MGAISAYRYIDPTTLEGDISCKYFLKTNGSGHRSNSSESLRLWISIGSKNSGNPIQEGCLTPGFSSSSPSTSFFVGGTIENCCLIRSNPWSALFIYRSQTSHIPNEIFKILMQMHYVRQRERKQTAPIKRLSYKRAVFRCAVRHQGILQSLGNIPQVVLAVCDKICLDGLYNILVASEK